jgi:hypothetical protein
MPVIVQEIVIVVWSKSIDLIDTQLEGKIMTAKT